MISESRLAPGKSIMSWSPSQSNSYVAPCFLSVVLAMAVIVQTTSPGHAGPRWKGAIPAIVGGIVLHNAIRGTYKRRRPSRYRYRQSRNSRLHPGLSRRQLADVQSALATLGYYNKSIDGLNGPGTRNAIRQFQREIGQAPIGQLSMAQIRELMATAQRVHTARGGGVPRRSPNYGTPTATYGRDTSRNPRARAPSYPLPSAGVTLDANELRRGTPRNTNTFNAGGSTQPPSRRREDHLPEPSYGQPPKPNQRHLQDRSVASGPAFSPIDDRPVSNSEIASTSRNCLRPARSLSRSLPISTHANRRKPLLPGAERCRSDAVGREVRFVDLCVGCATIPSDSGCQSHNTICWCGRVRCRSKRTK